MTELEPISRRSTAAIIADRLRDAITRGGFAPGAQLGEADLAARLGVSRGPLREAMQRLVQEGLLRAERHRGLFVVELGIEDVRDIYAARLAVEQAAARMVVQQGRREAAVIALTAAQQSIVTAAASGDPVCLADADQDFHITLVRSSGSPRLQRMVQTLLAETRMCLIALQATHPPPELLVVEHGALLDAVADGEEARLSALLEAHMADAVSRIEADLAHDHHSPADQHPKIALVSRMHGQREV
ncbi:MAG TPA: GntR family transcriptional regulator [Pseudonocardiaceae bacterium]|jgi:DNA-binding GntR family transcriptional regulator|nr:GntR family transcriptional regulator [Pseudonocardiaceae bacterium]